MFTTLCIALLCILTIGSENGDHELLKKAVKALNRTFDFILQDYKSMNVDAIYGVNTAQAQLIKTLEDAIDLDLRKNLLLLTEKAQAIYTLQGPNLKNFPYKYYVFNNYVIPPELSLQDIEFSYGKLNENPKVFTGPYNVSDLLDYARYVMKTTFNESFSDNCLVEVATVSNDTKPHTCPASKTCYNYMMRMPKSYDSHFPGYGVTHMALYLQIGKSRNCTFNNKQVDALLNQECSYILWEFKKNVKFGYIPQLFDLFLEQISICGKEGFEEFLQKEYLKYVLQEQDELGGFAVKDVSWKKLVERQRIKRESNSMKGGADNHTTGLATEVLALYIRFLVKRLFGTRSST